MNCPKYDQCSASMCPMLGRDKLLALRGYLAEDDLICNYREMATNPMVRMQRRLKKAGAEGLFTLKMMESINTARAGITGLELSDWYGNGPGNKARAWMRNRKKKIALLAD